MSLLASISICSDVKLPPDSTLISSVLVMVLRRKSVALIRRDFSLAA